MGEIARNINELSDIISDKSKNDIGKTDQIENKNNLKKKIFNTNNDGIENIIKILERI